MKNYSLIRQFNKRLVISGKILEFYEYEKPVIKHEQKRLGRANSLFTSEEVKQDNRKKTAQRARATVRRYANSNPQLNKFLTLTFAENITDLDYARVVFDKFVKRLKTRYKGFEYISVVEYQKRGAIHFHLLCKLPYMSADEIAEIWRYGFIKINRIDNVDNVGAYITKYMSKDNTDDRLKGRKCYSMSKTLKAPIEYTKEEEIEEVLSNIGDVQSIVSSEYESDYYGIVKRTQIICSTIPPKPTCTKLLRLLYRLKSSLTLMPDCTPTPFD